MLRETEPCLEVAAGEVQRLANLTARLRRRAPVGEEVHVSSRPGGSHPVAGGVDHVHELSVGPVQSVRGPHAVEERSAGVEAGDSAQPSLSKVAHIACSLSSQGTAQHMDVVVADLHLLHQPPDKLRRGVAHQLGVLTCHVVPGRQRQPLPVHCQDVEVPRLEVLPAESLRGEGELITETRNFRQLFIFFKSQCQQ